VTAAPTRIDVGETTALDVVAADSDGDALSYAWNADCDGSFSSVAAKSPSFKLSLVPATKACTFTVVVADGREGTNTGSVTIARVPRRRRTSRRGSSARTNRRKRPGPGNL